MDIKDNPYKKKVENSSIVPDSGIGKTYLRHRANRLLNSVLLMCIMLMSLSFRVFAQVAGPINSISNQHKFSYITIDEGLSLNSVRSICKDSLGYIWFGTANGLNKYDGYSVSSYLNIEGDSTSLIRNGVLSMLPDSKGRFWIGTNGGLCIYDYFKNNFIHKAIVVDNTIEYCSIGSMCEDKNGTIWMGTSIGLFSMDVETLEIEHFPIADYEEQGILNIVELLLESDSILNIGSSGLGFFRYSIPNNSYKRYINIPGDETSISENRIESIFQDLEGGIWIGTTNNGLNLFNRQTNSFTRILLDGDIERSKRVRSIVQDRQGRFWFGTRNGLYTNSNLGNEKYVRYAHTEHEISKLNNNSIIDIYIDNNDMMWLATYAGGVNYTNLKREKFQHYSYVPNNSLFLNHNMVQCFAEDKKGNLWIGTENGGLNVLNKKTGRYFYYTASALENSLPTNNIKCLTFDDNNGLWVGTYRWGLHYLEVDKNKFHQFKYQKENENSIPNNDVYSLLFDSNKNMWVGTRNGLCLISNPNKKIHRFEVNKDYIKTDKYKTYTNYTVNVLFEDKDGNIYVGTTVYGLFKFQPGDSSFKKMDIQGYFSPLAILKDSKNNLWMGTNVGLYLIDDFENSIYTKYSFQDGLPSNYICGILEDDEKNLWISTSAGLVKFNNAVMNPHTTDFVIYDKSDGLQSKQFFKGAALKSVDGQLFFGGGNGFNAFYPDSIEVNNIIPPVYINEFLVFNKPVTVGGPNSPLQNVIEQTKEIVLSWKQSVFSFGFVAINYTHPEKSQYAYKMAGFDPEDAEWNYTDASRRLATYTNLNPGEYTFMVKASNNDGFWNEEGSSIQVVITPPFWQTWWFRGIAIIFLLSIIAAGFKLRTRNINTRSKKLERLVAERTKQLESANTELESSLSQLSARVKERDKAEEALRKSEKMLKEAQRLAQIGSWELDLITNGLVWSDEVFRIFEIDPQKFGASYDAFLNAIHPDDREAINFAFTNSLETKTPYANTHKLHFPHGRIKYIYAECETFYDGDKPVRSIGTVQDITERKIASENAVQLASLVESSNDAIIGKTQDGIVTSWNKGAEIIYGYSKNEIIGKSISTIIPPECLDEWKIINDKLGNGEQIEGFETAHQRKDGQKIDVALTISSVFGENRMLTNISIIARDITERKRNEAINASRLHLIHFAATHSMNKLLEETLNEAEKLTDSCIGFYHFVEDDQESLTLQDWSTQTKARYCKAEGHGLHYSLSEAGVWVDCVRQRKPVIHNDYASLPHRKGMPEGHAELIRELVVPVFRGEKIAAILGVGNKPTDYNEKDVEAITLIADLAWEIAEKKQVDMALQEERNLFLGGPNVAFKWKAAEGWPVEYVSPNVLNQFGYAPEDFTSGKILFANIVHPDDLLRVGEEVRVYSERKLPFFEQEYRIARADGEYCWIYDFTVIVRDSDGTITHYKGYINDITGRKQIEVMLAAKELEFRTLAENSPDNIARFDTRGRTIYVNRTLEKTLGRPATELLGSTPMENGSIDDIEKYQEKVFEVLETGKEVDADFVKQDKGEGAGYYNVRFVAERGADGAITGVLAIGRDVTESKRAEEQIRRLNQELEQRVLDRTAQLEETNKELDNFAYSLAHDLRSPLRGIDGFGQILAEEYSGKIDYQGINYLQRIRSAAQLMGQLLDDILSLARVSKWEMNIRQVNLSEAAREISKNLHETRPDRQVEFIIQDVVMVKGDGQLLHVVLENLIGNAWKFNSKQAKATIEFGTFQQENKQVFFVRDNGVGFDMKFAQKLFGTFQRLHDSQDYQGTGIGLAIVQRIIHRHGGKVWAEGGSKKGATFYFTC